MPKVVVISEKYVTIAAVLSVAVRRRTSIIAKAAQMAPQSEKKAPRARASLPESESASAERCGQSITITPQKPINTAVQR